MTHRCRAATTGTSSSSRHAARAIRPAPGAGGVENAASGAGYEIHPGDEDGIASAAPDAPFGRGDVWILRYHADEIDDGVVAIGPPYEAGLDAWVNGEPISDHDVVLWYGAHFSHDVNQVGPAQHGHILGPDLCPVDW